MTAGLFGTLLTLFAWLGEKALKREAFGLGDVKLIAGLAAALGALPTLWIMLSGSLIAVVFMPIYTLKNPKFRRRGFAFGPFLAVGLGLWLLFGIPFTDAVLYPDMELDISAISFVNDHGVNHYDRYREHVIEALEEQEERRNREEKEKERAQEEGLQQEAEEYGIES